MKRVLAIVLFVIAAAYAADFLSARYRFPFHRQTLDSIEVRRDFAIRRKDNTFEYTRAVTEEEECVISLFPHFGDLPCWYLRRHTVQHVELDAGPHRPGFDVP